MKRQMAFGFIFYLLIRSETFATPSALAADTEPPAPMTDIDALLLLKHSFVFKGDGGPLSSWSASSSAQPCSWFGVMCVSGTVSGIRLSGIGLSGTINADALAQLKSLRSVSLTNNDFSGPFPTDLAKLTKLKSLFLSHNRFCGEIPNEVFVSLSRLKKLWLNHNQFTGPIPSALFSVDRLVELRLEHNALDGPIPYSDNPSLKFINVSENHLSGPVPAALARFGASAFEGNSDLCGPPLGSSCHSRPPPPKEHGSRGNSINAIVGAVVAVVGFIAVFAIMVCIWRRRRWWWRWRRWRWPAKKSRAANREQDATVAVVIPPAASDTTPKESDPEPSVLPSAMSNLVMLSEHRGTFGLPEMMKATAEVLGNGGLGSAYKAAMASGVTVAVKRMRDMNRVRKEAFDDQMWRLGKLRHPNVLAPLAYHYSKEEKLFVSDYIPKGSLRHVLHSDGGPEHQALDWPARVNVARGIARGMAYLHSELAELDVPHGNLKSSNVLLADDLEPLITDYGFMGLVGPEKASQVMLAYRTPEGTVHHVVSRRSDVYCLGIVILELVTGRFPSQYTGDTEGGTDVVQWAGSAIADRREAELLDEEIAYRGVTEEMVQLLRVGAACVEADPEERPEAAGVALLIEEIAGAVAWQMRQVGEDPWQSARTDGI